MRGWTSHSLAITSQTFFVAYSSSYDSASTSEYISKSNACYYKTLSCYIQRYWEFSNLANYKNMSNAYLETQGETCDIMHILNAMQIHLFYFKSFLKNKKTYQKIHLYAYICILLLTVNFLWKSLSCFCFIFVYLVFCLFVCLLSYLVSWHRVSLLESLRILFITTLANSTQVPSS